MGSTTNRHRLVRVSRKVLSRRTSSCVQPLCVLKGLRKDKCSKSVRIGVAYIQAEVVNNEGGALGFEARIREHIHSTITLATNKDT